MRQSEMRTIPMLTMAVLLSACAETDDPSQGGFLTGIKNLATGGYENRLEQKREELTEQEVTRSRLEEEQQKLDAQRSATEEARMAAEAEASRLAAEIDHLEAQLAAARRDERADKALLARMQSELDAVAAQRELTATDPTLDAEERAKRFAELNERRKILEHTLVDALDD